jgi:hypothetical protein
MNYLYLSQKLHHILIASLVFQHREEIPSLVFASFNFILRIELELKTTLLSNKFFLISLCSNLLITFLLTFATLGWLV